MSFECIKMYQMLWKNNNCVANFVIWLNASVFWVTMETSSSTLLSFFVISFENFSTSRFACDLPIMAALSLLNSVSVEINDGKIRNN